MERRARWVATLMLVMAGCVRADTGAHLDPRTLATLVVVHQTDARLIDVEIHDASALPETWLTAVGGGTTHVLGYDRPLDQLGVPLREGQLVLRDDGVPLPAPTTWLELHPDEAPRALPVSGEGAADPARDLPYLRLAPVPCQTLREDRAWRVAIPDNDRDVTFAAPIARDPAGDRALIAFGSDGTRTASAFLAIATSTGGLRRVQLGLDREHPAALDAHDPRGFVDLDGSAWVVTATVGGDDAPTTDRKQPVLCHFAVGGLYDLRACRPMRGLEPLVADRHFIRLAGFRAPGGALELLALTEQYDAYSWREDAGEDRWTLRFRTGVLDDPAICNKVSIVLTMDGPGVGAVTTPQGLTVRYDLSRVEPLLDAVFDVPACAMSYRKHPLGHELMVRQEQDTATGVTPAPTLHMRAPGATWVEVPVPPGVELDTASMSALEDTMLVAGTRDVLVPFVMNPLRPQLAPRGCRPVTVFNDGSQAVMLGPDELLVAGSLPPRVGRAIGRWRLVAE